jgi:hypothetical protein
LGLTRVHARRKQAQFQIKSIPVRAASPKLVKVDPLLHLVQQGCQGDDGRLWASLANTSENQSLPEAGCCPITMRDLVIRSDAIVPTKCGAG